MESGGKVYFEHLAVEIEDSVAVVTIDRHEARNALGAVTIGELGSAFDALAGDTGAGAVVLTGAGGKAFSAGADLEGGFDAGADIRAFVRAGQEVFQRIERFPKPVVAAVEGYAFGGGCELMLACDIVIAAENSAIGMPEISHGLMPGWRGTQVIPRICGKNLAMELLLGGGRIRAPRAAELGLVNKVVPRGEALAGAKSLAARLAKMPAHSVRLIKDAVIRGLDDTIQDGLEIEADNFADAFSQSALAEKMKKKE